MVTTAALLSAFCAAMSAISISRVTAAEDPDPVDAGAALIVLGITALTVLWAVLERSAGGTILRLVLGSAGTGLIAVGVAVVARYWDDSPGARR